MPPATAVRRPRVRAAARKPRAGPRQVEEAGAGRQPVASGREASVNLAESRGGGGGSAGLGAPDSRCVAPQQPQAARRCGAGADRAVAESVSCVGLSSHGRGWHIIGVLGDAPCLRRSSSESSEAGGLQLVPVSEDRLHRGHSAHLRRSWTHRGMPMRPHRADHAVFMIYSPLFTRLCGGGSSPPPPNLHSAGPSPCIR